MDRWVLGLDAWIVQDGNYGDFHAGQRAELAVELHASDPLRRLERSAAPAAEPLGESSYRITGRIVHRSGDAFVLDCGILTYAEYVPGEPPSEGEHVTGTVDLGVDSFPYFERLYARPGFPALIYTWRIEAIRLETPSPTGYRHVERTNAWEDDGGYASYLLDCVLLDEPAKRRSVTAVW